ncbi:MAG TPA: hypothetical protein VNT81_23385, partial [Vicinamibacterales bacterium]|nr:hypothetical protein [Vicinamibacterales bacterium]
MLRLTIPVIAALALISAACGGSQDSNAAEGAGTVAPASAAPKSRDACALITADEVEKILGS